MEELSKPDANGWSGPKSYRLRNGELEGMFMRYGQIEWRPLCREKLQRQQMERLNYD
jgi:hypothetical protein